MNKNEFLTTLRHELANLDDDTRNEILNDFSEHFDIALESGKSEEEICRILGDPVDIARDFTQGTGRPASDVSYGGEQDGRYKNYTPNKPADVSDKEGDFSVFRSKVLDGSFFRNIQAQDIRTIWLEMRASSLEITGGNYDAIKLESGEEHRFIMNIQPNGDLYIKEKRMRGSDSLNIRLPKDFPWPLQIYTKSGDVCVRELSGLDEFHQESASGDIEVSNISCARDFFVSTASGSLEAKNVSAYNVSIKSASGEIDISRVNSKSAIKAHTMSGDLSAAECFCQDGFNLSTASGDTETRGCIGRIKVTTGSGDIDIHKHTGPVSASSGSGDIEISTDQVGDVTYSTGSGDISVKCGKTFGTVRFTSGSGDIEFQAMDVGGDIKANTASGDIDIALGKDNNLTFNTKATIGGDVYNAFTSALRKDYSGSGYTVELRSVTGDINIEAI